MSNAPDEPEKPRPKVRAASIHDLRQMVTARHKVIAANKPTVEEGAQLIGEEYRIHHDSAVAFVQWLRGELPGTVHENKQAIDRIHVVMDPKTGDERYIDTEPGSIPPRPVGTPAPKKSPKGR